MMEWRSPCPVARTLDLVGDRWTLLVVRDLLHGKRYFHEFRASPEGIATNILADRLKLLEEQGFVTRTRDDHDGRRARYEPTERAETLRPLLRAIAEWGLQHVPGASIGALYGGKLPETAPSQAAALQPTG